MADDIEGIKRVVVGYSKIPNKYGNYPLEVSFDLLPVPLSLLQKIFGIDPNHKVPAVRDLIDCYRIDAEKAEKLQPYVVEKIDLTKYSFMLESESAE